MKQRFSAEQFFRLALALGILAVLIPLLLYAYLGTFSRYGSDDYCLSAFYLQDDLGSAMVQRYLNASNRYTNILFIGLVDNLFGWYNVAVLPPLMLVLFVWGLYLFLKGTAEMLGLQWDRWVVFFLSLLLAYFSVMQAPDLYETLYWRAGMTSHFAPVALMPFFGAFLLRQIRAAGQRSPSILVQIACFIIPLVIGGLSEPPTALMVTVLGLAILAAWRWSDAGQRWPVLTVLGWALLGALTSLVVMAVAPANSLRMQTAPPGFLELVGRVITYPIDFIVDTLRTLPLPTLISIVFPAIFFYGKYSGSPQSVSKEARSRLGILLLVVLVFAYLFIAASFAPSAYGQSYPAARARFTGRVVMTAALLMEGVLLGTLAAGIKFFQSTYLRSVAILALIVLAFYPLRTAGRLFPDVPVYQQRAAAWDARDAQIRAQKAEGIRDVAVPFLRDEQTQDLGDRVNFRLNRCAAILYGVDTMYAVPLRNLK